MSRNCTGSGFKSRGAMWVPLALVMVTVPACQRSSDATDGETTGGAETGASGTFGSTTFVDPDDCKSSQDCETDGACVAPYDPMPPDQMVQRGPASCVEACIEEDALSKWCTDNGSCCGELRCNPVDGFCEPAGLPPADGGNGSSGTATDTGTDSGTSTGSGTGTGGQTDSTSTGSSTSAETDTSASSSGTGGTDSESSGDTSGSSTGSSTSS